MSIVRCGSYAVLEAQLEAFSMERETAAEALNLATLGATRRADMKRRLLGRLPRELHADIHDVFKRAVHEALKRRPMLNALRASGARNSRASHGRRGHSASATTSNPDDPEPPREAPVGEDFCDVIDVFRTLHEWSLK